MPTDLAVLGVDGCPGGWIGARVEEGEVGWTLFATAEELVAASREVAAAAVDAPIGLPESGSRACDLAARKLLGVRGSTVFPAPLRGVLRAESYADACRISRAAQGKAMSIQAWNITAKVAELDTALDGCPAAVLECHPEVSFALLSGSPLLPKKTPAGAAQRVVALGTWVDVPRALAGLPRGPRLDDALDALACGWTADRVRSGRALRLPEGPLQLDGRGRPMQIVG